MEKSLFQSIYEGFKKKETEELIQILKKHDTDEWSDEAFEAAKNILNERGSEIPKIDETYQKMKSVNEQAQKANYRKRFWIGFVSAVAMAFIIQFIISPFQLFIAPFIGGLIAKKPANGANVGFFCMFIYGGSLVFQSGFLSTIPSYFTFAQIAAGGIGAALLLGISFGLWPGAILGLIGGFIGKLIKRH